MLKSIFEDFIADPKHHRIYEREALALQASEMILELMEKEGITKADLAQRIDASRAYVTQVLSGSRNMTMHTLADLAFALGHKIELDPLPLHGNRSAVLQYIPAPTEKQECLFGTSFPDPLDVTSDEEEHGELEGNPPVAA